MGDDREVLGLGLELLVDVDAGPEQLGVLGAHAGHLLGHLTRGCFGMLEIYNVHMHRQEDTLRS